MRRVLRFCRHLKCVDALCYIAKSSRMTARRVCRDGQNGQKSLIRPTEKKEPYGRVSVVIPTKNGGTDFQCLLEKLSEQKGFREIELIIVDSGSTDATVSLAQAHGACVVSIKASEFSH